MKVFKFGGASINDAAAVQNMGQILAKQGSASLLVVVSAMGKNTNALEHLLQLNMEGKPYEKGLKDLVDAHDQICQTLFKKTDHPVFQQLETLRNQLYEGLKPQVTLTNYNMVYDQIVCYGELLSSLIVHQYLDFIGLPCTYLDARDYIKTDQNHREGKVNWALTNDLINQIRQKHSQSLFLTQGFIASNDKGQTVTLGREGSDYTAAVFAYCLNAESVTIWKDVPGVLNADPKLWPETELFAELSYDEAAEMTYYGASVIHPKTIKPLANKGIPLFVRSFQHPEAIGTQIHKCHHAQLSPSIIFKSNQCLISFQVRDFTFVNDRKLSQIFHLLEELNLKINMMQSSAISFSICVDSLNQKLKTLINSLSHEFEIFYNDHLELVTIKNYNLETIKRVKKDRIILLEQKSRKNFQILTAPTPAEG